MAKTKTSEAVPKVLTKKTVSTNNFIALMVLVCVILVGATGYAVNVLGKDAFLQTKLIAKKIAVQKQYDEKIANATTLIEGYQQLGQKRDLIEHALPNTPDFPQIVSLIEFAGKSASVKVKTISPATAGASDTTQTTIDPKPEKVSFSSEVAGSYPKIIDFLKNLEFSARPMRVTAAEFKGSDANLAVTLEIETAYQVKTDISDPVKELK